MMLSNWLSRWPRTDCLSKSSLEELQERLLHASCAGVNTCADINMCAGIHSCAGINMCAFVNASVQGDPGALNHPRRGLHSKRQLERLRTTLAAEGARLVHDRRAAGGLSSRHGGSSGDIEDNPHGMLILHDRRQQRRRQHHLENTPVQMLQPL